jgi:hypothetical protein
MTTLCLEWSESAVYLVTLSSVFELLKNALSLETLYLLPPVEDTLGGDHILSSVAFWCRDGVSVRRARQARRDALVGSLVWANRCEVRRARHDDR